MSVNTINDLNGDCLSKIFQYLPVEERLIIENGKKSKQITLTPK